MHPIHIEQLILQPLSKIHPIWHEQDADPLLCTQLEIPLCLHLPGVETRYKEAPIVKHSLLVTTYEPVTLWRMPEAEHQQCRNSKKVDPCDSSEWRGCEKIQDRLYAMKTQITLWMIRV